jgi:hypothetical protein
MIARLVDYDEMQIIMTYPEFYRGLNIDVERWILTRGNCLIHVVNYERRCVIYMNGDTHSISKRWFSEIAYNGNTMESLFCEICGTHFLSIYSCHSCKNNAYKPGTSDQPIWVSTILDRVFPGRNEMSHSDWRCIES